MGRPASLLFFDLNDFKAMVQYSATKVSDRFYRASTDFGVRQYFTLLPVKRGDTTVLGTMVINLDSEPLEAENTFPDLLVDGDARLLGDAGVAGHFHAVVPGQGAGEPGRQGRAGSGRPEEEREQGSRRAVREAEPAQGAKR